MSSKCSVPSFALITVREPVTVTFWSQTRLSLAISIVSCVRSAKLLFQNTKTAMNASRACNEGQDEGRDKVVRSRPNVQGCISQDELRMKTHRLLEFGSVK